MESEVEKTHGKLEWFLYMIMLPVMFTVILTAILLQFLGYNIKGELFKWGNSIPYVEKVIPGSNPKPLAEASAPPKVTDEIEASRKQNHELTQKLKQEQEQLRKVEAEMETKDVQIVQLQSEIGQLKRQIEEAKKAQEEKSNPDRDVAQLYTSMSPSKAAPILEAMPMNEVVKIVKVLKQDERSAILAKLNPTIAAKITSELLKGE